MTIEERDKLLEELEMLKILLDFHVQNRQYLSMSDHEFEDYANAVLDRLNELNDLLDFKTLGE